MIYRIILLRPASKTLHKLHPDQVQRIVKRIDELGENPRPTGCRKIQTEKNRYRIRIGNYRVLYRINNEKREITVHRIALRNKVYK
ncbi:MAG: type II toxin-antitoxin system RelE/ParE family toxin [Candidatus Hatepunaea meridiana]|nr:type II toxin-antitoxin system RelE/ParE family toxin [Candidatus Hatepunaea meridiana]